MHLPGIGQSGTIMRNKNTRTPNENGTENEVDESPAIAPGGFSYHKKYYSTVDNLGSCKGFCHHDCYRAVRNPHRIAKTRAGLLALTVRGRIRNENQYLLLVE
jgi:hypothetical protein